MSWRQYLLVPRLIWYSFHKDRSQQAGWDRFWGAVRQTGRTGDVLWDAASERELGESMRRLLPHLSAGLPILDIGCGNGRFTRELAKHFPKAIGVDLSRHAVARAEEESRGLDVQFRVLDATQPGAGRQLAGELGATNVFIRGVLHTIGHERRLALIENLRALVGDRGAVYLVETAHPKGPLALLEEIGAAPTSIPPVLDRALRPGLPVPISFDEQRYREYFPVDQWETLASGPTIIQGVPLRGAELEAFPAFFAVARPR
jgi:SAM-dependent methyltransferase